MCTFDLGYGSSLPTKCEEKQVFGREAFAFMGYACEMRWRCPQATSTVRGKFTSTFIPSEGGHKNVFLHNNKLWPVQGSNL